MAKKKTMKTDDPARPLPSAALSPRGKALAWSGGGLVLAGFAVLTFADPNGRNWASALSPFMILGGYALLGLGLFDLPPDAPVP